MNHWLKRKDRKWLSHPVARLGKGHWVLSLVVASTILFLSLLALLSLPHHSLVFPGSAGNSPTASVDRQTEAIPLPRQESRQEERSDRTNPNNRSGQSLQAISSSIRWEVEDTQRFSQQPIFWAPEPAIPFSGAVERLPPDMRRIIERGTLIVALPTNDAFPFFYQEEGLRNGAGQTVGELAGLDIQIARSLAAYLGVEVAFDRSSPTFDAVINQVFEGNADLAIAKISLTLNRARKINYSQPYVRLRPGLLFNRLALSRVIDFDLHQNPVDAIRQLGSYASLGVIQASSYASFVRGAFPEASIREYSDWDSLVDAIIHGRVLAGCRDELAIKHEILVRPNANVQMQSVVMDGWTDEIAVALPWESVSLREFLNQYLSKANLQFTADQLLTQFLTADAR